MIKNLKDIPEFELYIYISKVYLTVKKKGLVTTGTSFSKKEKKKKRRRRPS